MNWMDLYPRPQLRRDSYYPLMENWLLNGQPIRLPFPPESRLSGFECSVIEEMAYETRFTLPQGITTTEDTEYADQRKDPDH